MNFGRTLWYKSSKNLRGVTAPALNVPKVNHQSSKDLKTRGGDPNSMIWVAILRDQITLIKADLKVTGFSVQLFTMLSQKNIAFITLIFGWMMEVNCAPMLSNELYKHRLITPIDPFTVNVFTVDPFFNQIGKANVAYLIIFTPITKKDKSSLC